MKGAPDEWEGTMRRRVQDGPRRRLLLDDSINKKDGDRRDVQVFARACR